MNSKTAKLTLKDVSLLERLLKKMRPGPYEYWKGPCNDFLMATCKRNTGVPIAELSGLESMPHEFLAIAALLNAAPELLKAARAVIKK